MGNTESGGNIGVRETGLVRIGGKPDRPEYPTVNIEVGKIEGIALLRSELVLIS